MYSCDSWIQHSGFIPPTGRRNVYIISPYSKEVYFTYASQNTVGIFSEGKVVEKLKVLEILKPIRRQVFVVICYDKGDEGKTSVTAIYGMAYRCIVGYSRKWCQIRYERSIETRITFRLVVSVCFVQAMNGDTRWRVMQRIILFQTAMFFVYITFRSWLLSFKKFQWSEVASRDE